MKTLYSQKRVYIVVILILLHQLKFIILTFLQCSKNMIPAHDNPLVAMAFDFTGTKIATASEKV